MPRELIALVAIFAATAGPAPARADGDVDSWAAAKLGRVEARARLDALKAEEAAMPAKGKEPIKGPGGWFEELAESNAAKAVKAVKAVKDARAGAGDGDKALDPFKEKFEASWKADAARRLNEAESKAGLLAGPGSGRRLALWSVLAVGAGVLLAWGVPSRPRPPRWQERSRAAGLIRRAWIGGLIAAFVGTAGWLAFGLLSERLPVITWSSIADSTGGIRRDLRREAEEARAETARADEQAAVLAERIDKRRAENTQSWATRFGTTPERWQALLGQPADPARRLLKSAYLEERLLELPQAEQPAAGRPKDSATRDAVLRAMIYAGLLLAALLPWLAYRYDAARRRATDRKTCPRCRQGPLAPAKGRATWLGCPKCNFEFPHLYRNLHRLCFPTVGVVGSGKTHWMLEAYHSIRQSTLPEGLRLERLGAEAEKRFDAELAELSLRYKGPAATAAAETALPHPLLFQFRDGDIGGSLLGLFDFGGEMAARRLHESGLRRRALAMDGFVFVLDPTKQADAQREALDLFCRELREARHYSPSEPLPIPVAVCLTKLDLLPSRTRLGERGLEWLGLLRGGSRDPLDLKTLHSRSALVREVIGQIFQEWDVLQTLQRQFGANFLLFPLSPVGIDEDDDLLLRLPKRDDHRGRAFAPFAVLEPILWLIHMHGYRVFH